MSSGGTGGTAPAIGTAGSGGSTGAQANRNLPPLVLGTFGTESGLIGANIMSGPDGIRAWVGAINAKGGVGGRSVKVIFGGDDNGDPNKARQIVQTLVEQDHVAGIIMSYDPVNGETGAFSYLEQNKVPTIGDISNLSEVDVSPVFFQPQTSGRADGLGFVTTLVTQSPIRKVALIYVGEATGPKSAMIIENYGPSKGLDIVYKAQVSLAQPSFTSEVLNAKNAGAQAVILVTDNATGRRFITDAHTQNFRPVFTGSYAFDVPFSGADKELFEGFLAYSVTANFQSTTTADYRAALKRYVPGGALGFLGPVAFAAGKTVEAAGPFLGNGNVGPAELRSALFKIKVTTLDGYVPAFSFVQRNGSPYQNNCLYPTKFVNGQWTTPVGIKCAT